MNLSMDLTCIKTYCAILFNNIVESSNIGNRLETFQVSVIKHRCVERCLWAGALIRNVFVLYYNYGILIYPCRVVRLKIVIHSIV